MQNKDCVRSSFARIFAATIVLVMAQIVVVVPARAEQAHKAMVVSENALASQAGLAILKQGGNAIDAATATALAVGITNPASCGIGGGGFMLIYIAKEGKFYALDYREVAPHAASADMYYRDGHPIEELAKNGPLAVAVPGEIAGIDAALKRFGTMKFQTVAAPAIKLARDGFPISDHLAEEIKTGAAMLAKDPGLAEVFLNHDGGPLGAGDQLHEKKLADTLEHLGNAPVAKFYTGPIGKDLVSFLQSQGGLINEDDLGVTGWWCMRCRRRPREASCWRCSGCWSPGICRGSA
jgi:gamma-glutamyltranspeptidase / glutathione hydrolase